MTYTYVEIELSHAAYDEIAAKMRAADYHQAFHDAGRIDMQGIAVVPHSLPARGEGDGELQPAKAVGSSSSPAQAGAPLPCPLAQRWKKEVDEVHLGGPWARNALEIGRLMAAELTRLTAALETVTRERDEALEANRLLDAANHEITKFLNAATDRAEAAEARAARAEKVVEAARTLYAQSTDRLLNGNGIEMDDGEKGYIIRGDDHYALGCALDEIDKTATPSGEGGKRRSP